MFGLLHFIETFEGEKALLYTAIASASILNFSKNKLEAKIVNFYIGNTINNVDFNDVNVELSDDLLEYIYNLKRKTAFGLEKLFEINPYDDVVIEKESIQEIVDICEYLQNSLLFKDYDKKKEAIEVLSQLIKLGQLAIKKGVGLVSIGD